MIKACATYRTLKNERWLKNSGTIPSNLLFDKSLKYKINMMGWIFWAGIWVGLWNVGWRVNDVLTNIVTL